MCAWPAPQDVTSNVALISRGERSGRAATDGNADTIRQVLGISGDLKMLFGKSFGYPDEGLSANGAPIGREPLDT